MDNKAKASNARPQDDSHHHHNKNYNPQLDELIQQLKTLNKTLKRIMTAEEKMTEYVGEMNTETTRIATLIEDLLNQNASGNITFDELVAGLQPAIDQLKAVGVTPPTP